MAKLGVRKDHQQNQERSLKMSPMDLSKYEGPKDPLGLIAGHLGYGPTSTIASRIANREKLAALAITDKCSFPECVESSASAAAAGGTMQECSSCHQARYCGRDCQLAHWR